MVIAHVFCDDDDDIDFVGFSFTKRCLGRLEGGDSAANRQIQITKEKKSIFFMFYELFFSEGSRDTVQNKPQ